MGMQYVQNLEDCIDVCDATPGCVDTSLSGAACYLKKALGQAIAANGISGGRLIAAANVTSASTSSTVFITSTTTIPTSTGAATPTALSCPRDNGTLYTAGSGYQFVIECSIDRPVWKEVAVRVSRCRADVFAGRRHGLRQGNELRAVH